MPGPATPPWCPVTAGPSWAHERSRAGLGGGRATRSRQEHRRGPAPGRPRADPGAAGQGHDIRVVRGGRARLGRAAARRARGAVVRRARQGARVRRDDGHRWRSWVAELGGGTVRLVWIRSDEATLLRRLTARGLSRDAAKLAEFERFCASMRVGAEPAAPHLTVDNRLTAAIPLAEQVAALAMDL